MQEIQALGYFAQKERRLLLAETGGIFVDELPEAGAGDELHDHKGPAFGVVPHIKDGDQVRALEIHALADAAKLDLLVARNNLQCDLPAGVGDGIVNLTESSASGGSLDRVTLKGFV